MDIHAEVRPLAALVGSWSGTGRGRYPTIEPFAYEEAASFEAGPRPFLAYSHRTTIDGQPRHRESGFLRVVGEGRLELVMALPTGHAEIGVGTWEAVDGGLDLVIASRVTGTPAAKDVSAVRRMWRLRGRDLHVEVEMAAVGQHLQSHLESRLVRSGG